MKTLRRRRQENKTNYSVRLKLLKSGKPRLVVRRTNKYFVAQYVKSSEAQDKIVFGITSKVLLTKGWPEKLKGSLKSTPAAYLTGFFMAKEIQEKKLETPIVDFGMQRILHKTRLFAFLKGMIDGGVEIKCDEEAFPDEERLFGQNDEIKKVVEGLVK